MNSSAEYPYTIWTVRDFHSVWVNINIRGNATEIQSVRIILLLCHTAL